MEGEIIQKMPQNDPHRTVIGTTLQYDQTRKAALSAQAEIGDYWIVNLPERVLKGRRAPQGGVYQETLRLAPEEDIAPLAAPDTLLAVADLLP